MLTAAGVTLRELRLSDASSLLAMLTTTEVVRYLSPTPTTVHGFEQFIVWTHSERAAGNYACFAIVPCGMTTAVGVIHVRRLERGSATAEWGFALGSAFWGTGLFAQGAQLVLDFAFETIGVERLEARTCVQNGRGNGALHKLGAVAEGVLRRSFLCDGQYLDQVMWSILAEDWRAGIQVAPLSVH